MGSIEVPGEIFEALNVPEDDREETLRRELAVSLYREGYLSIGKARELSGCSRRAFHQLLGERGVERHYTEAELEEDLDVASG